MTPPPTRFPPARGVFFFASWFGGTCVFGVFVVEAVFNMKEHASMMLLVLQTASPRIPIALVLVAAAASCCRFSRLLLCCRCCF